MTNKKRTSFDFDGVMHKSVILGTTHPVNFHLFDKWEPFTEMFEVLKKERENNRVVIVTKRDEHHRSFIEQFLEKHGVYVDQIICTNNMNKLPFLKRLEITKHYDDDVTMVEELKDSGIEFVLVNPFN